MSFYKGPVRPAGTPGNAVQTPGCRASLGGWQPLEARRGVGQVPSASRETALCVGPDFSPLVSSRLRVNLFALCHLVLGTRFSGHRELVCGLPSLLPKARLAPQGSWWFHSVPRGKDLPSLKEHTKHKDGPLRRGQADGSVGARGERL